MQNTIAENNIANLLAHAFHPEQPRAEFSAELRTRMRQTAVGRDDAGVRPWPTSHRRAAQLLAAAALLACVFIPLNSLLRRAATTRSRPSASAALAGAFEFRLTARPRPIPVQAVRMSVGEKLETKRGEKRRLALADGSLVSLNQSTIVTLRDDRWLRVDRGEVFVEVAPPPEGKSAIPLIVQTAARTTAARGTKFAVRHESNGTRVVVAQGLVEVSDNADASAATRMLHAGEELAPDANSPTASPRLTHVLDWTRELATESESPLVPASGYSGGALIALDPDGQEMRLSLRKFHIDVHIEDGFARTTIDQTYFNHENRRLEGTFYFPLPADASLSRLAMYVDGKRMEGGMAERDHARNVYETIVHSQRDPALLEWVDGSTFKMRVFPLEGRQEKRIVLSYSQRLESLYGSLTYRFPSGHNLPVIRDWSFQALVKGGANQAWNSESHELAARKDGRDLILDAKAQNVVPNRDVVIKLEERDSALEQPVFSTSTHDNAKYLMIRYRPSLDKKARQAEGEGAESVRKSSARLPRNWVIVFESSGDRDQLLARTQIEIIRHLLYNIEHTDRFTVISAGTRTRQWAASLQPASINNIDAAISFLEYSHLIGALNLGRALDTARSFVRPGEETLLVHVGSGISAMGERRETELVKHIPAGMHYVGVGVGKRWARNFMKSAAEQTGGYFTQINPDESIAWRSFDLLATLNTPRLLNVKVEDPDGRWQFLTFSNALAHGEELCAVARVDSAQAVFPDEVVITGDVEGEHWEKRLLVADVAEPADYLPRTWAKLEIDRLLAEDGAKNKAKIVALSMAMYVMSPFTSLLVLENEEMYRQYKVDRGRKDHWALYACPDSIPVVHEPEASSPGSAQSGERPTIEQVLNSILMRVPPKILQWPGQQEASQNQGLATVYAATLPLNHWSLMDGTTKFSGEFDIFDAVPAENKARFYNDFGIFDGVPASPNTNGRYWFDQTSGVSDRLGDIELQEKFFKQLSATKGVSPNQFREWRLGLTDSRELDRTDTALKRRSKLNVNSVDPGALRHFLRFDAVQPVNLALHLPYRQLGEVKIVGNDFVREEVLTRLARSNPQDFYLLYTLEKARVPELATIMRPMSIDGREPSVESLSQLVQLVTDLDAVNRARAQRLKSPAPIGASNQIDGFLAAFRSHLRLYRAPTFTDDDRIFFDLPSHAPGMNTTTADIFAVLENEAFAAKDLPLGSVDRRARELIERARQTGWRTVTFPARKNGQCFSITFDASGRFAYDRVLENGLREVVTCDGAELLHLYPELGIGARRKVSRFHRAEFADVLPWTLPPAEDLAHGADVKLIDKRTIAIVPHVNRPADDKQQKPIATPHLELVFGEDGRLIERRVVGLPDNASLHILLKENGSIESHTKTTESTSRTVELILRKAVRPNLQPDLADLVVLPLPYRPFDHVRREFKIAPGQLFETLDSKAALTMFAAAFASQSTNDMWQIFDRCFVSSGPVKIGFYTLLAACGSNVDPEQLYSQGTSAPTGTHDLAATILNARGRLQNVLLVHPQRSLARYLAYFSHPEQRKREQRGALSDERNGLTSFLAQFRLHYKRWQGNKAGRGSGADRQADLQAALLLAERHSSSPLTWALLSVLHDKDDKVTTRIADAFKSFEVDGSPAFVAKYQRATVLLAHGQKKPARELFEEIDRARAKSGSTPLIDDSFHAALRDESPNDPWAVWVRSTSKELLSREKPLEVVVLAWKCWSMGDPLRADELLELVLASAKGHAERLVVHLAVCEVYQRMDKNSRALAIVQSLLADKQFAQFPSLWRLAGNLAAARENKESVIPYLEKALELEFTRLPEVIDLRSIRQDYGAVLTHFQQSASAMATLKVTAPADFVPRVIRCADRWRALDLEQSSTICESAGRILKIIGAHELSWDYVTTPIAMRPAEASPWLGMAQSLSAEGEWQLANRAYTAAYEAEPTNAQILWDQARTLEQFGQSKDARRLYNQLAAGTWQPRFAWIQAQARSRR